MRVLLDTCVLSEFRKKTVNKNVNKHISEISDDNIFISVISIGEIAKGVSLLPSGKNKKALQSWLQSFERYFEDRILNIDLETVRIWGEMTASAQIIGATIPAMDGLIAATARCNGLHLMTRNIAHFEHTGAMVINPWDGRGL